MNLAVITPTRNRWPFLIEQAERLAPQLVPGDLWLIGCDRDRGPDDLGEKLMDAGISVEQTAFVDFDYHRGDGRGFIDRLANALAAFAPPDLHIVEVDDEDTLEPYALAEIRAALAAGFGYIFASHKQRVLIEQADGSQAFDQWPDVIRSYSPGDFAAHKFDAIGLRAVNRELWDRLGGRRSQVFPWGDYDLAQRAEASGAPIICIEHPLCTVTINPDGICGTLHRVTNA